LPDSDIFFKVRRVIPGLSTEHAIVSMPLWAWECLDEMVAVKYPRGYRQFMAQCATMVKSETELPQLLEQFASTYLNAAVAAANFNPAHWDIDTAQDSKRPLRRKAMVFPKAVQLFRFLPHATTWETILHRTGKRRYPLT